MLLSVGIASHPHMYLPCYDMRVTPGLLPCAKIMQKSTNHISLRILIQCFAVKDIFFVILHQ